MKKRIGLLASLALCVTVGGVYATWNYTQGTAVSTHASLTAKLASPEISTTAVGTLKVTATGGIKIDDVDNNYKADISFDGDTYFKISLENLAQGVDTDQIKLRYTITLSGIPNKDGSDTSILSYNMTGIDNELSYSELSENIELDLDRFVWKEDLYLYTKAEYDAYETLLKTSPIVFQVSVEDITNYNEPVA